MSSAEPSPKLCEQCGQPGCADLWRVCPACYEKNREAEEAARAADAKYEKAIVGKLRNPTAHGHPRQHSFFSPEHRYRETRSPQEFALDEEQPWFEQNARTDYHGGNYVDE